MCGILGISAPSGAELNAADNRAATAALAHRGPDDSGIFEDHRHGIALGHTRLSIQDLSPLGHQPMLSDDGQIILVFNGEIYNFRELRTLLESAGHQFRGHSDTEVLLRLYLECKARNQDLGAMLRQLNGIFAFALWDADRQALLVVRDALGVKPLYYSVGDHGFAFASEIKALLPLVDQLGRLNPQAIQRYMAFLWNPGNETPVKGVQNLGPGEAIWVCNGAITERLTWYRLPSFRPRPRLLDETEAVTATVSHLRTAVHRQLVADVPVGAFLSGGLDSSAITAFAREVVPDIRCFTIEASGGVEDGVADDLPYARQVASHLGVPLDVVTVDAGQMALDLASMVDQLDEPLADPAPLNVLYISRLARANGIKVLLSGAGGDDLFTGYRRHRAIGYEHYWGWLPQPARSGLTRLSRAFNPAGPFGRRLRKAFDGAHLSDDERLVNYFKWSNRDDLAALFSAEFKRQLAGAEASEPMLHFLAELPQGLSPIDRMLAVEQRFFLTDHNLIYTDKMSMAAGVEVRVPFLDLDLVEFAHSIPANIKQKGGEGKWVLKKAMEPFLPHNVIYRPKSGFGAPLRRWIKGELRDFLNQVLSADNLKRRGIFDPAAVQALITANAQGRVDASYTLFSMLCIELWCRRFVDRQTERVGQDTGHD